MGDPLLISALQHVVFCPRQAALIHVEQAWAENSATAHGAVAHERVHTAEDETRPGRRIARAVPLSHPELGLVGVSDVVEYHADPTLPGGERPIPIEYKRGSRVRLADKVQLCAQALCLEFAHNIPISEGFLYSIKQKRRTRVALDQALRTRTLEAITTLRDLVDRGHTPPPEPGPKCKECSLREICQPEALKRTRRASAWLHALWETEP